MVYSTPIKLKTLKLFIANSLKNVNIYNVALYDKYIIDAEKW